MGLSYLPKMLLSLHSMRFIGGTTHPLVTTVGVATNVNKLQSSRLWSLLGEEHDTFLVTTVCTGKFFRSVQGRVLVYIRQNCVQARRQILNNFVAKNTTPLNILLGIRARMRLANILELSVSLVFLGVQQIIANRAKTHHLADGLQRETTRRVLPISTSS